MAKFAIACPKCGKYAEAKTGFFAGKKIDCSCGNTIHVRTDKMAVRKCPHCGNQVLYDQSKGKDALCPVCSEPINTLAEQQQAAEFFCGQCGVRLNTSVSASTYVCPVCDYENQVQERLTALKMRREGLAGIIKYEGDNETLVWKHPLEDFNFGSQLIVHESQEAVFFKDGQALDLFGAGRYLLETQQLPLFEKAFQLPTDTEGTFHSEIYYINLATQMGIKWGTDSKVRLFDPVTGLHLEIGASGEFNIRVSNSRKLLLKVIGTTDRFSQSQLFGDGNTKGFFRSMVITQVKSYLAQTIKEKAIPILEIDSELLSLSEALREKINASLAEYGLTMPEFFVSRVVTPDDDPNFCRMKEQYAQQYLSVREQQIRKSEAEAAAQRMEVEAVTAARMKMIGAQGEAEALKLKAQAEAEALKMQAEAEAMGMRMKGYTYQQETARQVGLEAMKNGLTGGGAGMSAIGELAGLGVGLGAVGSMAHLTKDAISPVLETVVQTGQAAVPPVSGAWDCACGAKSVTGNFCSNCGAKKPAPSLSWTCACGQTELTGNFCQNCGARKPE